MCDCHSHKGVSPSAPTGDCTLSIDEATTLADVHDTIAPHLILHACSAHFLMSGINCQARTLANWDRNNLISTEMRPHAQHNQTSSPLRPNQFRVGPLPNAENHRNGERSQRPGIHRTVWCSPGGVWGGRWVSREGVWW